LVVVDDNMWNGLHMFDSTMTIYFFTIPW
jgi:hypothetical protein